MTFSCHRLTTEKAFTKLERTQSFSAYSVSAVQAVADGGERVQRLSRL